MYEVLWKTFVQHGQDWFVDGQEIEAIYSQYSALLEHKVKAEKTWSQASFEPVDKWKPDSKSVDHLGLWQPPSSYGFLTAESANKHQNQLRKISTSKILDSVLAN